ncbi:Keratin-associated protein 13-1 [Lemmus lemmus]
MSCQSCSGNFSSQSFGGHLQYPVSSCGSSYPTNVFCSPSPCQVESSLKTGCQETCIEPTSCQRSCVVSRPCQTACYYPRRSTPCSPCQGTYAGSLGFGSSSCRSLGYGSRSCYSGGCGYSGFRSLNCGVSGFPSLCYGSRFYYPAHLASTTFQPSCYRSIYGIAF